MSEHGAAEESTINELHRIDDEMRESLGRAIESIDEFSDFLCKGSTPRTDSEYAIESHDLTEVQTWAVAVEAGLSGFDHLRYFAESTLNTGRVTAFASFTVLRSAITSIGLAGWLVGGDRESRLTRTLTLRLHEAMNKRKAALEIVNAPRSPSEPLAARRASASEIVRETEAVEQVVKSDTERLGFDWAVVRRMPTDAQIIKSAAELVPPKPYYEFGAGREVLMLWRVFSAYAHGQTWAARMSSRSVITPSGAIETQWAPDREGLMKGFNVAWDLMYGTYDRYIDLAGARSTSTSEP